jgi:acyl transferase domain-containing protein
LFADLWDTCKSKPGLGHSEAASGLTALIKVALALEHGKLPPTYGVGNLNPTRELGYQRTCIFVIITVEADRTFHAVRLDSLNMKVVTDAEDWSRELRRASVNAFGYGGANAHAILEGPGSYLGFSLQSNAGSSCHTTIHGDTFVLPVSAASSRSLETRISQIRNLVEAGDRCTLQRLAHTLGERTSHLSARSVLYAKSGRPDKNPEILNLNDEQEIAGTMGLALPVAMVFTGQGAQYANMCKDLLLGNEVFRRSVRNLDCSLKTLLPPEHVPQWTLESALLEPPEVSRVHQAIRSQPLCTAIQIGLVDLFHSWGMNACAVVGHSSGEIAAAYAAGLLSAPQAITVAYFRGWAVDKMTRKGAMIAAGVHADVARALIKQARLDSEVSIACINSPESVTLSGTIDGTDHLMTEIQKLGKFARKLRTGERAYHSVMMEEVGQLYEDLLTPHLACKCEETPKGGQTAQMYSSVQKGSESDALVIGRESMSARYWRQNLEQPVQFSLALSTLLGRYKKVHLVEVGPHPSLKGPVQQVRSHLNRDHLSVPYSCTLIRDSNSDLCMKQLSGNFFLRNHSLSWNNVNCIRIPSLPINLPPYPWDYSSGLLWHEPRASIELRNRSYPRHELLGSQQVGGNGIDWAWRNVCSLSEVPWLRDHKLESQIVFPASCYLAMAIEALSQIQSTTPGVTAPFEFRHVSISTALIVPDEESREGVELHTTLRARGISRSSISKDWHEFSISSFAGGKATMHCLGSIRIIHSSSCVSSAETNIIANPGGFEEWPNMSIWYNRFASEGLKFGPSFQSVERLQTDNFRARCEAKATIRLMPAASEGLDKPRYQIHPITIDACIQVAIMGSGAGDVSETHVYLPVFIDECRVYPAVSDDCHALGLVQATSTKTSPSTRRMTSSLWSAESASKPLLYLQGVRVTQYKAGLSQAPTVPRQPCLKVRWKPDIRHVDTETAQGMDRYIAEFVARGRDAHTEPAEDEGLVGMGALVDLAGHSNPRMRVLELRDDARCRASDLLRLLGDGTGFRRCKSWDSGSVDDTGSMQVQASHNGVKKFPESPFDLLVVHMSQDIWSWMDQADSYIFDQGLIIARNTATAVESLRRHRFIVTEFPGSRVILASRERQEGESKTTGLDAILVVRR